MEQYQENIPPQQQQMKRRKRFHFSKSLEEEFSKMAGHANIQNPQTSEDPANRVNKYSPNFSTETAKLYHWVSKDPKEQERIDKISNLLGISVESFFANDLKTSQRCMIDADIVSSEIKDYNDKQICKGIFDHFNKVLSEKNPQAFQKIVSEDLQKEQPNEQPARNNNQIQGFQQTPVVKETPSWKQTMSILPVFGPLVQKLPDQKNLYDATLNAVLGDNWSSYKPYLNYGLMGTGAVAASYFLVYKPFFSNKKSEEIVKPKKKRRRKRNTKKQKEENVKEDG